MFPFRALALPSRTQKTGTSALNLALMGGAPTGKLLQVSRIFYLSGVGEYVSYPVNLTATFGYDNEGRMTSLQYPSMLDERNVTSTGPSLGFAYDAMGRPYSMTDTGTGHMLISSASYGPASELTNITGTSYSGSYSETRSYNSLKQVKEVNSSGLDIQYNYPSTANNGKIASQTDVVSGEQVNYAYDALNRLASAWTSDTTKWGLNYGYDGFGNLTSEATFQGTLTQPSLTASYYANNHAGGEDANGNPGSIYLPADGMSYAASYDVENRLVSTGSSTIFYGYAPGNKRVWKGTGSFVTNSSGGSGQCATGQWSTDEITFWGVNGQKLATFQLTESPNGYYGQCDFSATATGTNYYFSGRLLKNAGGWIYADRLGSIGKYYPYGEERPSATTNGTEKFTGYFRDLETGNDYAVNRYMSPGFGRFFTPDRKGGNPSDPGSWNKYAYTGGDPINRADPTGLDSCIPGDDSDCVPDSFCQDDTLAGMNGGGFALYCEQPVIGDGPGPPDPDPTDPTPPTPSPTDPVTTSPPTDPTITDPPPPTDPTTTDPGPTPPMSPAPPSTPPTCGVILSLAVPSPCAPGLLPVPIMPVGFGNCEAAVETLAKATARLVQKTLEWLANILGLRDANHRKNMQIAIQNVKNALTQVNNACGSQKAAAAAVAAAEAAIAAAAAAISTLTVEPLPL